MLKAKLEFTSYLEVLITELVKIHGRTKMFSIDFLLSRIEQIARNGKMTAELFGLELVEAATLVNARGLGAKHEDPVQLEGGEAIAFDITLLEKTGKSKTGFAGVYTTSGGTFRALVPDVAAGGSRYLASRKTALAAAIDRFHHFDTHGIPYGHIGWHVEQYKSRHSDWSTERCLVAMVDFANMPGGTYGLKNPYTLDEVEKTLARHRIANKIDPKDWTRPSYERQDSLSANSSAPTTLDVVVCIECKEPIEEGEPFSPRGASDFIHAGCT